MTDKREQSITKQVFPLNSWTTTVSRMMSWPSIVLPVMVDVAAKEM